MQRMTQVLINMVALVSRAMAGNWRLVPVAVVAWALYVTIYIPQAEAFHLRVTSEASHQATAHTHWLPAPTR